VYFTVIFAVHCVLCIGLIGLVLIQQGKGADAGATFGGGGGSNTVLGTGGADFITKLTTGMAIAFMVTSIMLVNAYTTMPRMTASTAADPLAGSVMEKVGGAAPEVVEEQAAPVEKAAEEADAVAGTGETATAGAEVVDMKKEATTEEATKEEAVAPVAAEAAEAEAPVADAAEEAEGAEEVTGGEQKK
jgi:preprotein translocase subunit SecG